MKRGLNIVLVAAILGFGAWYFLSHLDDLKKAQNIGPYELIGLALLNLLSRSLAGARLKLLTSALGVKVSFGRALRLSFMQAYINGVLLKGGTAAVAYYFRRVHELKIEVFLGLLAAATVLSIAISCSVLLVVGLSFQREGWELILVSAAFLLTASVVALVLPKRRWFSKGRLEVISRVIEGASIFRGRPTLLIWAIAIEFSMLVVMALRLFIAFKSFSEPATILACFIYSPITIVGSVLAFTPQGLGLKEVLVGYATLITGAQFNTGVFAATLDRAVQIAVSLTFGLPATAGLIQRNKESGEQ